VANEFNLAQTLDRAFEQHAIPAANKGRDIAIELHEQAPRGGRNINFFGDPRSAPGEPPAQEFGDLLRDLRSPVRVRANDVRFIVNRGWLEDGTVNMAPRPLGLLTLNRLRQLVQR